MQTVRDLINGLLSADSEMEVRVQNVNAPQDEEEFTILGVSIDEDDGTVSVNYNGPAPEDEMATG